MGKFLIILMIGLSVTSSLVVYSRNARVVDSARLVAQHFSKTSARNAANSGIYMALNRLYQDGTWRTGYNNLALNLDSLQVTVADISSDSTIPPYQIRITASALNPESEVSAQAMAFNGDFHGFAVWARDSVSYVTTQDSSGGANSSLQMEYAPFMPKVDYNALVTAANNQGHSPPADSVQHWHPTDAYPNGDFFYQPLVPNVTHVQGDMHVRSNHTVYGIYIVEGKTLLDKNAKVEGILYAPNTGEVISHQSKSNSSTVKGGILTWDAVIGRSSAPLIVQYWPAYWQAFVENYAPDNPTLRVLSWR